MACIDLHTHTTASDGGLSPTELVTLAAEKGVTILGVTDHDTIEGHPEALRAGAKFDVEIVPGVELNTDLDNEDGTGPDHADVLGYLFDREDAAFTGLLQQILDARENRARIMVERLQALGAPITYDEVAELSGTGAVGRPHIARALLAHKFVPDISAAFRDYIGRGGPAYAERYRLSACDACRAIRAAGGVPVLAHPVPPNNPWSDPLTLRTFLPPLVDAGLGGIECYYSGYTPKVNRWLEALAGHFGLVPSGGSDYHGPWRDDRQLGSVNVPLDTLDRLRAEAARIDRAPDRT